MNNNKQTFHPGISKLEVLKFSIMNILCEKYFNHHQARHFIDINSKGEVFYNAKHVGNVSNVDKIIKEEDRKHYIVFDYQQITEHIEHCCSM